MDRICIAEQTQYSKVSHNLLKMNGLRWIIIQIILGQPTTNLEKTNLYSYFTSGSPNKGLIITSIFIKKNKQTQIKSLHALHQQIKLTLMLSFENSHAFLEGLKDPHKKMS